ncbi:hypothetical protein ACGFI9_35620 [Micromonospora sp. NPDC048930]|uniref:hypothetical protein n=1 Tax=Micromonospora sp. NPDC048930 TaxID=3364261 RepID=UPI0037189FCA
MAEDEVVLRLSRDEALVLFEWLYRTDKTTNDFVDLVEDQAEQRALWNLTCLLERELVEPYLCRRHTGSRLRLVLLAVRPMASVRARTAPVSIGRMAE